MRGRETGPATPLTPDQEDAFQSIDEYQLLLAARRYMRPKPGRPHPLDDEIADDLRGTLLLQKGRIYSGPMTPEVTRRLAELGLGSDSEIAHVTPGELVLHPSQLSPETYAAVVRDLTRQGISLGEVSVGGADVRRNPRTGAAQRRCRGRVYRRSALVPLAIMLAQSAPALGSDST